jgi:prepilin-type N-terminal cleavage/methylation domain-containing protein
MSGTRKRQGVTLVELSLVIAILAMIALPFAAFVSQNLRNTVQSSTQLKEQLVLEQVMQDMEKHLRSAVRTPSLIDISTPNRIDFYSVDPKAGASNLPTQTRYAYSLAGGLLTKTVGTSASATFPDGLEAGMITSLTFPEWNLDPTNPPCYITVLLRAGTTAPEKTVLQKTIYLRNYSSTVNVARILGVTRVIGNPQVRTVDTAEYTGTVGWFPEHATFAPGVPYRATITLTAKQGFSLTGLMVDFFTVEGATTTTNPVTGVVTAEFPSIGAIQLTITNPTLTLSKPYDGNTTAAVTAVGTLGGVVSGDTVAVTAAAAYDSAAVGIGKTITVVYALGGADASKYAKPIDYTVSTGVITTKQLTITKKIPGVTVPVTGAVPVATIAETAQYTGTVLWTPALTGGGRFKNNTVYTATITLTPKAGYTLMGVHQDFFTVAGASSHANDTDSGIVTAGFDHTTGGTTLLAITDPTLTLSKSYDGNRTAAVTAGTLSGVVSGDVVTVSATATYNSASVGTGKTITVVYALGGADAGNYVKPMNDGVGYGVITPAQVTAIGAIDGTPQVDQRLTAGVLTPSGATVTYQWQRADSAGGTYTSISGATSRTYRLGSNDEGHYVRVVATGTDNYSGTVASAPTTVIAH